MSAQGKNHPGPCAVAGSRPAVFQARCQDEDGFPVLRGWERITKALRTWTPDARLVLEGIPGRVVAHVHRWGTVAVYRRVP